MWRSYKRENTDWEGNKFAVVQQLQCSPLLLWFSDYDGDLLRFNTVLSNTAFLIINLERLNCHLRRNFTFHKYLRAAVVIEYVQKYFYQKPNWHSGFILIPWTKQNRKVLMRNSIKHILYQPFLTSSIFMSQYFSTKIFFYNDAETI